MTEKQQASVKCPFFVGSRKNSIECESFIGSAAMLTRFSDVAAMTSHVGRYCVKEDGGTCPLAMNLYDKYARLEKLAEARDRERRRLYLKDTDRGDTKKAPPPATEGKPDAQKARVSESVPAPAEIPSRSRQWRF